MATAVFVAAADRLEASCAAAARLFTQTIPQTCAAATLCLDSLNARRASAHDRFTRAFTAAEKACDDAASSADVYANALLQLRRIALSCCNGRFVLKRQMEAIVAATNARKPPYLPLFGHARWLNATIPNLCTVRDAAPLWADISVLVLDNHGTRSMTTEIDLKRRSSLDFPLGFEDHVKLVLCTRDHGQPVASSASVVPQSSMRQRITLTVHGAHREPLDVRVLCYGEEVARFTIYGDVWPGIQSSDDMPPLFAVDPTETWLAYVPAAGDERASVHLVPIDVDGTLEWQRVVILDVNTTQCPCFTDYNTLLVQSDGAATYCVSEFDFSGARLGVLTVMRQGRHAFLTSVRPFGPMDVQNRRFAVCEMAGFADKLVSVYDSRPNQLLHSMGSLPDALHSLGDDDFNVSNWGPKRICLFARGSRVAIELLEPAHRVDVYNVETAALLCSIPNASKLSALPCDELYFMVNGNAFVVDAAGAMRARPYSAQTDHCGVAALHFGARRTYAYDVQDPAWPRMRVYTN